MSVEGTSDHIRQEGATDIYDGGRGLLNDWDMAIQIAIQTYSHRAASRAHS